MKHDGQVELTFAFGPFRFDPHQRVLLHEHRPVPLGSRARDILLLLLERAGETVPKRELINGVWPGALVEEGTLRVHIAALRRALGDGGVGGARYVENVTGFGYRFIAAVTRVQPGAPAQPAAETPAPCLPVPLTRMLGREEVVSTVKGGLPQKRLMTIVGPGGIGKTTVAVVAAEQLRGAYPDGVHCIDLQSIGDPGLVCTTIAAALGLTSAGADPYASLVAYCRSRHLLLVLDNCEHVVDAAAQAVEQLLAGSPGIHIVATSREPLRARSEWVLRLEPLELPPRGAALTSAQALGFAAVQLFVERAHASLHTFELDDEEASIVADMCHRLDGLPLAIELAAARVEQFGVSGLARCLDDCLGLLTQGRRTAVPRQQTLRATLDWSYELLSLAEQRALCKLAVFAGSFDAASVVEVVADGALPASRIVDLLASLAAKSLLTVEAGAEPVWYRLLNSSRAYALEKLASGTEQEAIRRRHAQLCCRWADEAGRDGEPVGAAPDTWRRRIEDVRAAIDWCFSPEGDPLLGLTLAARSAPLWFRLSLHSEYRIRLERALQVLRAAAPEDARLELELSAALGEALVYIRGGGEDARAAHRRALDLAEHLGTVKDHWRAVWGLYVDRITAADYEGAVSLARRFKQLPVEPDDLSRQLMGERMMATAHYLAGQLATARRHAERVLSRLGRGSLPAADRRLPLNDRVAVEGLLPPILWMLGFPQQAKRAAEDAIRHVLATEHPLSVCYTLALVCPALLWAGERTRAKALTQMLLDQAAGHLMGYWSCWGASLKLASGSPDPATEAAACIELGRDPLCTPLQLEALATVRPELASTEVLERAERGLAGWCTPELLRIKAERLAHGQPAEALLQRSLAAARTQGALSWELRSAMSLGRLRAQRGRRQEAHALLESVLHRFTEGFDTPDLLAAQALLAELACRGPSACAG